MSIVEPNSCNKTKWIITTAKIIKGNVKCKV